MIYGTTISLHVAIADPDTDLGATIDEVTDELAQIDQIGRASCRERV